MPKRIWIAAISILIVYWCTYQGTEGYQFISKITFVQKQAINLGLLLLVAIIGYWGLLAVELRWPSKLYIIVYAAVVTFIAGLGAIDLFLHFSNASFRNMVGYLRLFFTSPVPFSVILILHRNTSSTN